jgi:hypothetical protein
MTIGPVSAVSTALSPTEVLDDGGWGDAGGGIDDRPRARVLNQHVEAPSHPAVMPDERVA